LINFITNGIYKNLKHKINFMKKLCNALLILSFAISSFAQSSTFIDTRNEKVYKTVKIGGQTWMAENLAFNADSNCWAYYNDQNFVAKYGYLYNWETAKTVCPAGWHLPSEEEFETLIKDCGGNSYDACKALSQDGSSGFSARFGGWYCDYNKFYDIGKNAYFWSSTPDGDGYAYILYISSDSKAHTLRHNNRSFGYSVRCIIDN